MFKKNFQKNKGFTLIELMVSISVFSLVMVMTMGSILAVLDANRKSQTLRSVMDNLNYSLDGMTRTIRFGSNYHCGSAGNLSQPMDCSGGGNSINLNDSKGNTVNYSLASGQIMESINATPSSITSSDVTIQSLKFYVFGSSPYPSSGGSCILADCSQPRVIVLIKGLVGASNKSGDQSSFTLETTLSQRKLDLQ